MGFTETFECDSIPLPPAKKLHPLSGVLTHIKEMALYVDESGWEHYEELLCTTNDTTYLFYLVPMKKQRLMHCLKKGRPTYITL